MPNLGAMVSAEPSSGDPATTATTAVSAADPADRAAAESAARRGRLQPTVLADLPGLVEGAHTGKGLGRLFLRHLRRVRVVLYVVDTSRDDLSVTQQYEALRNELRLYNPQYLERPHIVALNKLDVPLEAGGDAALAETRKQATRAIAASASAAAEQTAPPVAIVPISARRGKGMRILKEAIDRGLATSATME